MSSLVGPIIVVRTEDFQEVRYANGPLRMSYVQVIYKPKQIESGIVETGLKSRELARYAAVMQVLQELKRQGYTLNFSEL